MKIQDAIRFFGSQAKLAKALGINPSAVAQWGEEIPQRRQYEIERLTSGRLKADAPAGEASATPPNDSPDDMHSEISRLSSLIAELMLLIEDMERVGNAQAEVSLRVQYHQAMADLLDAMQRQTGMTDARSEGLRQRHVERAVEYQRSLDRMGDG